ncbi:MAG: radical SAM protein [Deltaproteobacteria bacterium]|nr:radical SAM protein [Deltaproteobacteria bacterium]
MAKGSSKRGGARADRPRLLVASDDGRVFEHDTLELALDTGLDVVRAAHKDVIPIPKDWALMAMPGTRPVGYDPTTGRFETVTSFVDDDGVPFAPWAVAVHPPPGYVRAFHPAAEYQDTTHPDVKLRRLAEEEAQRKKGTLAILDGGDEAARPGLPLWAYTAAGMTSKGPVAGLFLADEVSRWEPRLFYRADLDEKIAARLADDPDNRVLAQLARCGKDYLCCCAQNIFYERWEGALPIAPACTAACLGCLSKEPAWETPVPQKRLGFQPTVEEIARVIVHHLERAPEPMISFGQGCEGEPTMNGPVIVEAIARARAQTKRGVINLNTNGSRPETIRACARAGCGALRVSINTFDRELWAAYYRPSDFTFDDVIRSLYVGRDEGMHLSINLLLWPGWTDRMAEIDAISKLVDDGALQMIQLRNLCVDPGHFRTMLPPRERRGIVLGVKGFVAELRRRHPALRFGTFNPRLAADWYREVPAFAGRL